MKRKAVTLSIGEPEETFIAVSVNNDFCHVTVSRWTGESYASEFITLSHQEMEEIGAFINKEVFTKNLEE